MAPGTKRAKVAARSPCGKQAKESEAKKKAEAAEVASGPKQQLLSRWFGSQQSSCCSATIAEASSPCGSNRGEHAAALAQDSSSPTGNRGHTSATSLALVDSPSDPAENLLNPGDLSQTQPEAVSCSKPLPGGSTAAAEVSQQISGPTLEVTRIQRSSKFDDLESLSWQQYNNIYKLRLDQLRDSVDKQAHFLWSSTLPDQCFLPSLIEHSRSSCSRDVVLIGIIAKDMKLRPSVLQNFSIGCHLAEVENEQGKSFCSEKDTMWLEDRTARVQLELHKGHLHGLCTGLVVAVRGRANASSGSFCVSELCLAWVPAPPQRQPLVASNCSRGYLALMSGLSFGSVCESLTAARGRAIDFLARHSSAENCSNQNVVVEHVVICGGLLDGDALTSWTKGALEEADATLSLLASRVTVDLMPGKADPSNLSLPQLPLPRQLFQRLRTTRGASFLSNPAEFCLDGMHFLGRLIPMVV